MFSTLNSSRADGETCRYGFQSMQIHISYLCRRTGFITPIVEITSELAPSLYILCLLCNNFCASVALDTVQHEVLRGCAQGDGQRAFEIYLVYIVRVGGMGNIRRKGF